MERLLKKFETAKKMVPGPKIKIAKKPAQCGAIFFGTTASPAYEAVEALAEDGIPIDTMRIRSFPFSREVEKFIADHSIIYSIEQNRDGQMRRLLMNECEIPAYKLTPVLHYDGMPITARSIIKTIKESMALGSTVTPLHRTVITGERSS